MKVGIWLSEYSYLTSLLLQPWLGALSLSCWQSHGFSPALSGPHTTPNQFSRHLSHENGSSSPASNISTFQDPGYTRPLGRSFKNANRMWFSCSEICSGSPFPRSPRHASFSVVLVSWGCCYSFSQTGWLPHQFWGLAIQDQGAGGVCFFWGSRRRICSVPLSFLPAASDNPSLVDGILPVSSHRPLSMPVCLCVQFPLHKGTSHTERRPTFLTSSCLDSLRRCCFQLRSHSQVLGVRTSTSLWWIHSTSNTCVAKPFIGRAALSVLGIPPVVLVPSQFWLQWHQMPSEFQSLFCRLSDHLRSLCLDFFIFKMGITVVPSSGALLWQLNEFLQIDLLTSACLIRSVRWMLITITFLCFSDIFVCFFTPVRLTLSLSPSRRLWHPQVTLQVRRIKTQTSSPSQCWLHGLVTLCLFRPWSTHHSPSSGSFLQSQIVPRWRHENHFLKNLASNLN